MPRAAGLGSGSIDVVEMDMIFWMDDGGEERDVDVADTREKRCVSSTQKVTRYGAVGDEGSFYVGRRREVDSEGARTAVRVGGVGSDRAYLDRGKG
jgi:hypothetical protein